MENLRASSHRRSNDLFFKGRGTAPSMASLRLGSGQYPECPDVLLASPYQRYGQAGIAYRFDRRTAFIGVGAGGSTRTNAILNSGFMRRRVKTQEHAYPRGRIRQAHGKAAERAIGGTVRGKWHSLGERGTARREKPRSRASRKDLVFEPTAMGNVAYVVDPRIGFHSKALRRGHGRDASR